MLKVPPGHPNGMVEPLELPDYGVEFLRDALSSSESLLCLARKNAKSAIVAVYLLGRLIGPLRFSGYKAGVTSINKEKSAELWTQASDIAEASGIAGCFFGKVPRIAKSDTGLVQFLSADKNAGHGSSFDDAIVDELGLLKESSRDLVNGMRSALSAKGGRFIALSILGTSPFCREMIDRRDDPGVSVHLYQAPEGCRLDDREAWAAANPGLSTIKSLSYMEAEARRVLATPADQSSFRAYDLNQRQNPSREMLVAPDAWQENCTDDLPERDGYCVVGLDAGETSSFSAFVVTWPFSGRMEIYAGTSNIPDLIGRGESDGVGALYQQCHDRGEMLLYDGHITPIGQFLKDCAARIDGQQVLAFGADRFRFKSVLQGLADADLRWPVVWRGQGASATADGSSDVRAFQTWVHGRKLRVAPNAFMTLCLGNAVVRRDGCGNPALDRRNSKARIDAASAAVIAVGLADEAAHRERPGNRRYRSVLI